jgi:hypothetical protein
MTDLSHCCMLCAAYLPLPHPTPIVTMFTELRKVFSLWQHISEEEHDMTPYHVPSETGRKLDGPWVQIPWCAPIALMNDAWCRGNHMSEERKLLCTTSRLAHGWLYHPRLVPQVGSAPFFSPMQAPNHRTSWS